MNKCIAVLERKEEGSRENRMVALIAADSFPVGMFLSTVPSVLAVVLFFGPLRSVLDILAAGRHNNVLPFLPYASMFVQSLTWCLYGLLEKNRTVYLPNAVGCVLGAGYALIYATRSTRQSELLPLAALSATAFGCLLWVYYTLPPETAVSILGVLACTGSVVFMGSPLVQLGHVVKTKSVESMPFEVSLLVFGNGVAWSLYGESTTR